VTDWGAVGRSRNASGARMVSNVFSDGWIAVEGSLVWVWVGRTGIMR